MDLTLQRELALAAEDAAYMLAHPQEAGDKLVGAILRYWTARIRALSENEPLPAWAEGWFPQSFWDFTRHEGWGFLARRFEREWKEGA